MTGGPKQREERAEVVQCKNAFGKWKTYWQAHKHYPQEEMVLSFNVQSNFVLVDTFFCHLYKFVETFSSAFQAVQLAAPTQTITHFFLSKPSPIRLCVGDTRTERGVCLSPLHFPLHPNKDYFLLLMSASEMQSRIKWIPPSAGASKAVFSRRECRFISMSSNEVSVSCVLEQG